MIPATLGNVTEPRAVATGCQSQPGISAQRFRFRIVSASWA